MKRAGDVKWGQIQIGAVVVAAIAFLLWASMKGGDAGYIFAKKRTIKTYFHDVKGLVEGAPVKLNGFEVGNIDNISFDKFEALRKIEVTANISHSAWKFIRKDSHASILSVGFFGDRFMALSAGGPDQPQVAEGDTIPADETPDMMETLAAKNGPLSHLGAIMVNVDSLLAATARGEGSVGKALRSPKLYDQMLALSTDLRTLSQGLQQNQQRAVESLLHTSNTMDSLGHDLRGPGSIGRAMRDSSLYVHMAGSAARLDSIMTEINSGRGNMGKLARDEALYNELQANLKEVHNILKDLQANPKKYLKISIF